MKISIVCGHYIPKMGYLEVHLSRALSLLGYRVQVITSDQIPPYVSHLYSEFGNPPDGVEVHRLKTKFKLGQIVVADGINGALESFAPDLIIAIGLGKRFPKPIFKTWKNVVTLFGDNAYSYKSLQGFSGLKTKLVFRVLKASTYMAAVKHSQNLVAYTPESFDAAAQMVGGRLGNTLKNQRSQISLGFWPEEFFYDSASAGQNGLGWSRDSKVIITATRLKPEKELERFIPVLKSLPTQYKWLLVGSGEDEYARSLETKLISELGVERFRILPHQDRTELNRLYNAADFALYTVPAISIFEALGTGLPALAPLHKAFAHIPNSGVSFIELAKPYQQVVEQMEQVALSAEARANRVDQAIRSFSWMEVASQLLEIAKGETS